MKVTCHDQTSFANFSCSDCGAILHIHRSQVENTMKHGALHFTSCKACYAELLLPDKRTALAFIDEVALTKDFSPFRLIPARPGGPP
jgi:NAD-dependent SIR2 family protein deacetylase